MGCLAEFVNMIYALLLVDWYIAGQRKRKKRAYGANDVVILSRNKPKNFIVENL